MAWNYPEISLEQMIKLIKGFVDILILASGYQSSGLLSHWDPHNIIKTINWASFFEHVLGQMSSSEAYLDSVKELDLAIHEVASSPSFPQGLRDLSFHTLNRASNFVLVHLLLTLPLRDSHLRAFLTAIIEMDLENISRSKHDCLSAYLNKLMLHSSQVNSVLENRGLVENSTTGLDDNEAVTTPKCTKDDLTRFSIQELLRRQSAVSCISIVGMSLDILSNAVRHSSWMDSDSNVFEEEAGHERAQASAEYVMRMNQMARFITWSRWKSGCLSYFLHKRTIRLVSGASMIFSGPKLSWVHVFEQLNTSANCKDDDHICETIELMLLGCIASKWTRLIEYLISGSYKTFTISKLYQEVCNLLSGRSQSFPFKELTDSKESGILEYLTAFLDGQFHQLWKLSPVLVAVAIPFWLYLSEIETQCKGDSSLMRCCSCLQERKEHQDCQLSERIWWLHHFHVSGTHVMYPTANNA